MISGLAFLVPLIYPTTDWQPTTLQMGLGTDALASLLFLIVPGQALPVLRSRMPLMNSASHSPPIRTVEWTDCTQADLASVQCADLSVPLDWDNAGASESITLLVARLPASGEPHEKLGTLMYNPGGPGSMATRGIADYTQNVSYLSEEIKRRFDIGKRIGIPNDQVALTRSVGVDPRGIGHSTSLECDGQILNERVSRRPQNEAEYSALVQQNSNFARSCREKSGNLIDFMDTVSAARDIEALRLALGNEPLNALAFSYGTQLFLTYAELYPRNIRALVLDGLLDHSQPETISTPQNLERTSQNWFASSPGVPQMLALCTLSIDRQCNCSTS